MKPQLAQPAGETPKEQLSALMDGAVVTPQIDAVLTTLCARDGRLSEDWHTYHLIGDVLRSAELAHDDALTHRKILAALQNEPPLVAPRLRALWQRRSMRRQVLPAGAALAAVAMVGWMVWPQLPNNPAAAQAQLVGSETGDGSTLAEYVAAHQQFSPALTAPGMLPLAREQASGGVQIVTVSAAGE